MKKKQILHVHLDVYNTTIVVYFGYDGTEVWKDLKKKYAIDPKVEKWVTGWKHDIKDVEDNSARTVSLYHKGGGVLIMLGSNPRVGTIAHEAVHAISYVMKNIGIPFNRSTEEAWSYAIGYFIDEVIAKRK